MASEREQITIRVAPDGSITAETHNITGAKCMDYIETLENLLDATTTSSEFTADYTRQPTSTTTEARNDLSER